MLKFIKNEYYDKNMLYEIRFNEWRKAGKVTGESMDDQWTIVTDLKTIQLDLKINRTIYESVGYRTLQISYEMVDKMLRAYTCTQLLGTFIGKTVQEILRDLRLVIEHAGETIRISYRKIVDEFFLYCNVPVKIKDLILSYCIVKEINYKRNSQRDMQNTMEYLIIADAIRQIIEDPQVDDERFRRLFPIYFWTEITFRIPLRPTEMLVTPYNCIIDVSDDTALLVLRRTRLKGPAVKEVNYSVLEDYEDTTFEVPKVKAIAMTKKYQSLTNGIKRPQLFLNNRSENGYFSPDSFTKLLNRFIEDIDTSVYEFPMYTAGLTQLARINQGDSRVLAMTNLIFSGADLEKCRQLAGHEKIETSAGYCSNLSDTVYCSSIMEMDYRLNYAQKKMEKIKRVQAIDTLVKVKYNCKSPRRQVDSSDICDCIDQKHLHDCLGCKYYVADSEEWGKAKDREKEKVEKYLGRYIALINDAGAACDDKLALDLRTSMARYRDTCTGEAQQRREEWERSRSSRIVY